MNESAARKEIPDDGEEAPLRLADTSEGSTTPVAASQGGGSSFAAGTAAGEPSTSGGEASTGGFETVLGKLVVQRGLATSEEVELCKALQLEASQGDEPRTLESLGQELGLSKERIRQLEAQALSKLRKRLESVTGSAAETLTSA